jgi:integrase
MKGHVEAAGRNRWHVVVEVGKNAQGKRVRRRRTVTGTKRQADAFLSGMLAEIEAGRYFDPTKLTVGEYLEKWLEDDARIGVALKTYERYSDIVRRHIIPALGQIPLDRLKPLHVQSYYSQALATGRLDGKGGLSSRTVLHIHRLLHEALKQAVRWQLLVSNPCDLVEPPRPETKQMQVLDERQTLQLLDALRGNPLYTPILVSVTTGLRRGELLALRWTDVDLVSAKLHVQQAMVESRDRTITFKSPKTPRSRRVVTLPQHTNKALKRHKKDQNQIRLALGESYHDNGLVFATPTGDPLSPDSFSQSFRTVTKRCGLPIRLQDLRHTHATQLLRQGIHPKVVSERLGHSSVAITLDIYSHVVRGMDEAAAESIDRAYGWASAGEASVAQ